jgi:hypothetical protein
MGQPTLENSARTYRALARFGAPLSADRVTEETFTGEEIIYQIGVAPVRIDICTSISGVAFAAAWPDRVESRVFGLRSPVISLRDLIANKRAPGRAGDAEDLKRLEDAATKTDRA